MKLEIMELISHGMNKLQISAVSKKVFISSNANCSGGERKALLK